MIFKYFSDIHLSFYLYHALKERHSELIQTFLHDYLLFIICIMSYLQIYE